MKNNKKKKLSRRRQSLSILLITLGWPILQILIFYLRFHQIPTHILWESHVFLPLGFISSFLLIRMESASRSNKQKVAIGKGYLIALPFAVGGSLIGGLSISPEIGATLFGLIPLLIGMGVARLARP